MKKKRQRVQLTFSIQCSWKCFKYPNVPADSKGSKFDARPELDSPGQRAVRVCAPIIDAVYISVAGRFFLKN